MSVNMNVSRFSNFQEMTDQNMSTQHGQPDSLYFNTLSKSQNLQGLHHRLQLGLWWSLWSSDAWPAEKGGKNGGAFEVGGRWTTKTTTTTRITRITTATITTTTTRRRITTGETSRVCRHWLLDLLDRNYHWRKVSRDDFTDLLTITKCNKNISKKRFEYISWFHKTFGR